MFRNIKERQNYIERDIYKMTKLEQPVVRFIYIILHVIVYFVVVLFYTRI